LLYVTRVVSAHSPNPINTRVQTPTQCCCVFMRRGEIDDENGFG
jgi:hypothetical protein